MSEQLSVDDFAAKCVRYNEAHGIKDVVSDLKVCPVHVYATSINKPCKATVPTIKYCQLCGKAMCPVCGRHSVHQLSRVTGYVGEVGGWNNGKQQELKDRKRYAIKGEMI